MSLFADVDDRAAIAELDGAAEIGKQQQLNPELEFSMSLQRAMKARQAADAYKTQAQGMGPQGSVTQQLEQQLMPEQSQPPSQGESLQNAAPGIAQQGQKMQQQQLAQALAGRGQGGGLPSQPMQTMQKMAGGGLVAFKEGGSTTEERGKARLKARGLSDAEIAQYPREELMALGSGAMAPDAIAAVEAAGIQGPEFWGTAEPTPAPRSPWLNEAGKLDVFGGAGRYMEGVDLGSTSRAARGIAMEDPRVAATTPTSVTSGLPEIPTSGIAQPVAPVAPVEQPAPQIEMPAIEELAPSPAAPRTGIAAGTTDPIRAAFEKEMNRERGGWEKFADWAEGVGRSGGTSVGAGLIGGLSGLNIADQEDRDRKQEARAGLMALDQQTSEGGLDRQNRLDVADIDAESRVAVANAAVQRALADTGLSAADMADIRSEAVEWAIAGGVFDEEAAKYLEANGRNKAKSEAGQETILANTQARIAEHVRFLAYGDQGGGGSAADIVAQASALVGE